MKTGIIAVVVLIIVAGAGWYFRGPIGALFVATPNTEEETKNTEEPTTLTYASSTMGVSVTYPREFTVNDSFKYPFSATKPISGVAFTIPSTMATGTNLSSDTYLSVEQLPRAKSCTGDIFMKQNVRATDVLEGGVEYSMASSSEAAAGNRYDESIYAIKNSKPCTAIRYVVHSTSVSNYPAGSVEEFNRSALMATFDQIRRSLTRLPSAPATNDTP